MSVNRREFIAYSAAAASGGWVAANANEVPRDFYRETIIRANGYISTSGNFYQGWALKKIVEDFKNNNNHFLFSEFGGVDYFSIGEENKRSHQIVDLNYKSDTEELVADIQILDTPEGNKLKPLLESKEFVFTPILAQENIVRGSNTNGHEVILELEPVCNSYLDAVVNGINLLGDIKLVGIYAIKAEVAAKFVQFCGSL